MFGFLSQRQENKETRMDERIGDKRALSSKTDQHDLGELASCIHVHVRLPAFLLPLEVLLMLLPT